MYSKAFGIAGLALSLFAVPAFGHHSFSMFDQTQFMNLTGTVTEFEWINPHAWLHVSVTDESGSPETWSFEGGNLGGLARAGWRADSVAAGEQVEIGFNPAFLLEVLRVVHSEEIIFAVKEANRPGVIRLGDDYVYVIMPVNLSSA